MRNYKNLTNGHKKLRVRKKRKWTKNQKKKHEREARKNVKGEDIVNKITIESKESKIISDVTIEAAEEAIILKIGRGTIIEGDEIEFESGLSSHKIKIVAISASSNQITYRLDDSEQIYSFLLEAFGRIIEKFNLTDHLIIKRPYVAITSAIT